MRVALALVLGVLAAWPASAGARATPPPVVPLATAGDPVGSTDPAVDLRRVVFGQRGEHLFLRVQTAGAWHPEQRICLALSRERPLGSLCLVSEEGRFVLRHDGRPVRAVVSRPSASQLAARLRPHDLGAGFGLLRWAASSSLQTRGRCAAACTDEAPGRGTVAITVSPLRMPPCFGAAARASARPCSNPALARVVVPRPSWAAIMPDACRPVDRGSYAALMPCELGRPRGPYRLALVGDSHAQHFRAAVDVIGNAMGWRVMSMTRPGCSFSTEAYPLPPPGPGTCRRHTASILNWLRTHPSVGLVVTSASAGRGLSRAGYRAAWSRLPGSVERLFVIRDVPRMLASTAPCVGRVRRKRALSAGVCARLRAAARLSDPAAAAALVSGSRVRLLDLSNLFCSPLRCFPVIGGVYAYKDYNHLNAVFARTLGPVLMQRMGLSP